MTALSDHEHKNISNNHNNLQSPSRILLEFDGFLFLTLSQLLLVFFIFLFLLHCPGYNYPFLSYLLLPYFYFLSVTAGSFIGYWKNEAPIVWSTKIYLEQQCWSEKHPRFSLLIPYYVSLWPMNLLLRTIWIGLLECESSLTLSTRSGGSRTVVNNIRGGCADWRWWSSNNLFFHIPFLSFEHQIIAKECIFLLHFSTMQEQNKQKHAHRIWFMHYEPSQSSRTHIF